jgi:hypothetical protein
MRSALTAAQAIEKFLNDTKAGQVRLTEISAAISNAVRAG